MNASPRVTMVNRPDTTVAGAAHSYNDSMPRRRGVTYP
jgi:hypothetical protein